MFARLAEAGKMDRVMEILQNESVQRVSVHNLNMHETKDNQLVLAQVLRIKRPKRGKSVTVPTSTTKTMKLQELPYDRLILCR